MEGLEPDGYILDELAGVDDAVIEALARFHQHRGGCAQCANWKRVQGVPSRLCGTGWELYSAVERAEKEAR